MKIKTLPLMGTPGAHEACPAQAGSPFPVLCIRTRKYRSLVFLMLHNGKRGPWQTPSAGEHDIK